ncbi:hypothetical protein HHK36_027339 [Tetracentron sinense]|uniref:DUF599 domain-containing protein n=1 Tax=Tetracentron sinense TaxID=13715 RepID=A0A834YEQ3_TETSI|nr:hypothetical protein HHK36_027339 [Tetracentron sinense]
MKRLVLDYFFVCTGLAVMVAYHTWLVYRVVKHPSKTVMGINAINRRIWVRVMMEDAPKNGVLAVQTLRNNIMASTLLASMAIMLSSVIAIMMSNGGARPARVIYGDTSELGFSIKYFSILVCFLLAFLLNVQSIRYYSHASILISVPMKKIPSPVHLTAEYVGKIVNRGSHFWSLGLRAFYFSFPLFLWIFGPIPMFLCCLLLVFLLFFLDLTFEFDSSSGGLDDQDEADLTPSYV